MPGSAPDHVVARELGVCRTTVLYRRRRAGIPACRRCSRVLTSLERLRAWLGEQHEPVTSQHVAGWAGISDRRARAWLAQMRVDGSVLNVGTAARPLWVAL